MSTIRRWEIWKPQWQKRVHVAKDEKGSVTRTFTQERSDVC